MKVPKGQLVGELNKGWTIAKRLLQHERQMVSGIGGISALVPERRKDLAKVGLRAMVGGALASWMTGTIAGVLIG